MNHLVTSDGTPLCPEITAVHAVYWKDYRNYMTDTCPECVFVCINALNAIKQVAEGMDDEEVRRPDSNAGAVVPGHPVTCGCSVCHAIREPFEEFHEKD